MWYPRNVCTATNPMPSPSHQACLERRGDYQHGRCFLHKQAKWFTLYFIPLQPVYMPVCCHWTAERPQWRRGLIYIADVQARYKVKCNSIYNMHDADVGKRCLAHFRKGGVQVHTHTIGSRGQSLYIAKLLPALWGFRPFPINPLYSELYTPTPK